MYITTTAIYTVVKSMHGDYADKKEALKRIIKQLHEGRSPDELKNEFREFLAHVTPLEIAQVEEELVKEGLPREEIRKLCDLHLRVFEDALGGPVNLPDWHPVAILLSEHKMLIGYARDLLAIVNALKSEKTVELEALHQIIESLKSAENHYVREENVLFPLLEKHGITEPPAVMWMEHDAIRALKKEIYKLAEEKSPDALKQIPAEKLLEMLQSHFYKENNILFPASLRVIGESEWHDARKQFDELGYCCFTPEKHTHVEREVSPDEKAGYQIMDAMEGKVNLETGTLSIEELIAMLNSLPVDISFVDSEDTVRYYNDTKDRIFPRTKAVIGRKVQNCHPQKSVDKVNAILNDFRNGKRDRAEFWINLKGRLIYIRYFPVRDRNGKYLGCLEVTQDITEVKKIEGEKRLLD
jgi:PAS domain S-box-containing protein